MLPGLPMTKSSLSNSLNSSGGTFNSNSSLNSTPSADRYAALKDLDEQSQPVIAKAFCPLRTFALIFFISLSNSSESVQESIPVASTE
jgi:hypothetical protein